MVTKKQRQRRLARAKWERQQVRRSEQSRKRRRNGIVVGAALAVALVLVAGFVIVRLVGGDSSEASASKDADASPTPTSSAKAGQCAYDATDKAAELPPKTPDKDVTTQPAAATLRTGDGTLEAELDGQSAPCAVNSFAHLAESKAFDGTECTELSVDSAKYLECGPSDSGYTYAKENQQTEVPAGRLVIADDDATHNGGRFLVTYGSSTFDEPVTVVGTVESGLDVIKSAAKAGFADENQSNSKIGRPKASVEIKDVKVTAPKS